MCAWAHYYDSNICHPRWVTYMQEHTVKPPVHATHNKWHVRTNTSSWLQFIPPTASGIHARAYHYHDSSVYHPRQMAYMQKRTTIMTPVYVTHSEWHISKSILLSLQHVPLMACVHDHPTKPLVYTIHSEWNTSRAYYHVSSVCHPRRVVCMQEHDAQNPSDSPLVHSSKGLENSRSALGESYWFTPPCL